MKVLIFLGLALLGSAQGLATVSISQSAGEDPRILSVPYEEGRTISLTAAPDTAVSILLHPSDPIIRVETSDQAAFAIAVSERRDGLVITPLSDRAIATVTVGTGARTYVFEVVAGPGLAATPFVHFEYPQSAGPDTTVAPNPGAAEWSYRLRGDREVRPLRVIDDETRTYITFAPEQYLPAVFAIGPTGKEEVVDGYMRGDVFVIDRVHQELVFRIDKEKARAIRQHRAGGR